MFSLGRPQNSTWKADDEPMRRNLTAYLTAALMTAGIVASAIAVTGDTALPASDLGGFTAGHRQSVDHGADPAPPGVDVTEPVPTAELLADAGLANKPVTVSDSTAPPGTPPTPMLARHVARSCYGTGTDGNRVHVFYARETGQADRYAQVLPVLAHEVANVDDTFALSARKTGGGKRVRWVTDANCDPVITAVVLPAGSLGTNFAATVTAMKNLGYNAANRKYLLFSEGTSMCGIAQMYNDSARTLNWNDGRAPLIQRVDQGCWTRGDHSTAAHELMHSLGSINSTAPHKSGNGHCNDDQDAMCYADGGATSNLTVVCPGANAEYVFDCKDDDYFAAKPATGSYLANNWNTANSSFLADATPLTSPVTVTVASSTTTPTSGKLFTLTATATGATTYAWTGSHITSAKTARTVDVLVPAGTTGTFTYTVKTVAADGVPSTGSKTATVTLTGQQPPAPKASSSLAITQLAGYPTRLTGTLRRAGTTNAITSQPVTLQVRWYGTTTWVNVAALTTTTTGQVGYSLYPSRLGYYRFTYAGNSTYSASVSAQTLVKVPTYATMAVKSGRPDTISGTLKIRKSGIAIKNTYVTLQTRKAGVATWSTVSTFKQTYGSFAYKVQPKRGTYYRWVFKGTGTYLPVTSSQGYVAY